MPEPVKANPKLEPLIIRAMSAADVDLVIEIGTNTSEFRTGTEAAQFYSRDTLLNWIEEPTGIALTASEGSRIVGFVLAQYMPASRDGYLNVLAVMPDCRKKGYGGMLLEGVLARLEALGCNHVFGAVQITNERMVAFLKRHRIDVGDSFNYIEAMLPRKSRDT